MGILGLIGGAVASVIKKAAPTIVAAAAGALGGLFAKGSKNVGGTESYDNETSTINDTNKINGILASYSEEVSSEARRNEKLILREINEVYDEIIFKLKMADILDDYNANKIKKDRKQIESLCVGGIEKHINKRISIDDSECLRILKMPSGNKKENEMIDFSKRVISEGIRILSRDLKGCIESDQDLIYTMIREKYNENNAKITNEKKSFEEIIKLQETGSSELDDFIKKKEEKIKLAQLVINNAQIGN